MKTKQKSLTMSRCRISFLTHSTFDCTNICFSIT